MPGGRDGVGTTLGAALVAAALGFVVGTRFAAPPPACSPPAPTAAPLDLEQTLAEHRSAMLAMLRSGLQAQAPTACPAAAAVPETAAAAAPEPSAHPRASEAEAQAEDTLAQATRAGEWGPEQISSFREAMGQLPAERRDDLMRRLMVGINSGALHMMAEGPPI